MRRVCVSIGSSSTAADTNYAGGPQRSGEHDNVSQLIAFWPKWPEFIRLLSV